MSPVYMKTQKLASVLVVEYFRKDVDMNGLFINLVYEKYGQCLIYGLSGWRDIHFIFYSIVYDSSLCITERYTILGYFIPIRIFPGYFPYGFFVVQAIFFHKCCSKVFAIYQDYSPPHKHSLLLAMPSFSLQKPKYAATSSFRHSFGYASSARPSLRKVPAVS